MSDPNEPYGASYDHEPWLPWSRASRPETTTLHRGMGFGFRGDDLPQHITQAIHESIRTGQPNEEAAHQLLDHLGGAGRYWTTTPGVAEHFAENESPYGSQLHVVLSGDHDGQGEDQDWKEEDPDSDDWDPYLEGEDEVRLHPGTKINVHTVRAKQPGSGQWTTLMSDFPHERTSSRRQADAEQAKQTGGMIALYPRTMDAEQMAVPGGEPPEDLHCTLVYFGDDVSDLHPADLPNALYQLADVTSVISAWVFGHANFNPSDNQAAVYIVNADNDGDPDSDGQGSSTAQNQFNELTYVQEQATSLAAQLVGIPPQHQPFIPHITASYYASADSLQFTGQIQFDKIGLSWQGHTQYFPLAGA